MAVDSHPISVQDLSKTYRIPVRDPGLRAALKSVVRRRTEEVEAVKEISFEVTSGEIVGFLGPNGAGKTTTLKMMSGLLNPSGGAVTVLGAEPFKRERSILRQITHVLEGRSETVLGSLGVNAPTPTAEGTPIPHRYAVCGVDVTRACSKTKV